ncbi:MAG: EamA family transporter [Halobacteriaceae archaeon]
MGYLRWAVLALLAYSAVAPLVSYASRGMPSTVVALVANGVLLLATAAVVVTSDTAVLTHATDARMPYALLAGACLSVGILSYYRALATGPVSIVVPVFGLFIVTSSLLGVAFLDEPLTLRKVVGVVFAVLAVVLVAGD